jgi:hypothetical protein
MKAQFAAVVLSVYTSSKGSQYVTLFLPDAKCQLQICASRMDGFRFGALAIGGRYGFDCLLSARQYGSGKETRQTLVVESATVTPLK